MDPSVTAVHGKERPFIVGLLLSIVTLGLVYPLYWHYKVHDELARQMRRENKAKGLWIGYIVLQIIGFILAGILLAMFVSFLIDAEGQEPTDGEIIEFFVGLLGLVIILVLVGLVSLVLFILYAVKMYEQLGDAARRMGFGLRGGGAGAFFGLYFGGVAAGIIIPFIGWIAELIMIPWAYFFFQESYNDVWRGLKQGQRLPSDAEWAAGGMTPPSAGSPMATGHGGAPYGAPPPAYGAPPSRPPVGPTEYRPRDPTPPPMPGSTFMRHHTIEPSKVQQSFECPRCRAHIAASGEPGARVDIRCSNCGEGGQVTLPAA